MLSPDNRHVLVEAFRPPDGTELTAAVGTTFTLELDALLLAPVALAMHDLTAGGEAQPLAVLESVRRYADRITLFCQAGAIAPRAVKPIFTYLEDVVVPITMDQGRLFHPKVWVLRFDGESETTVRLLCLSRNLTFDTSWDTILVLDGTVSNRRQATNGPLADFLLELPKLAGRAALEPARFGAVEDLADTVRHVAWNLPTGFDDVQFWPLGRTGWKHPELWGDRLLVISPFLSGSTIAGLAAQCREALLVSRGPAIDEVGSDALATFGDDTYVVNALLPDEDHTDDDALPDRPYFGARGVHAKTLIYEQGWHAWWYTGSANATVAGLGPQGLGPTRNIEFLVELQGKRSRVGIDIALDQPDKSNLRALLEPHVAASAEHLEPDPDGQLQYELDKVVRAIAAAPIRIVATERDDAYDVILHLDAREIDFGDSVVTARLGTLGDGKSAVLAAAENEIDIGAVSLEGLTAFVIINAAAAGRKGLASSALVKVPIEGVSLEERKRRVLAAELSDPEQLVRFLLFLLSDEHDPDAAGLLAAVDATGATGWSAAADSTPLLEVMLNALASGADGALDRVASVLADLDEESRRNLPPGLLETWDVVVAAREKVRR